MADVESKYEAEKAQGISHREAKEPSPLTDMTLAPDMTERQKF